MIDVKEIDLRVCSSHTMPRLLPAFGAKGACDSFPLPRFVFSLPRFVFSLPRFICTLTRPPLAFCTLAA